MIIDKMVIDILIQFGFILNHEESKYAREFWTDYFSADCSNY